MWKERTWDLCTTLAWQTDPQANLGKVYLYKLSKEI